MQLWPFEGFKRRLIILGILAWVVKSFTYLQIKLFYFTLKAYLRKNKWGNSEINAVVLFWFLLWAFTLVITKTIQQVILLLVLPLNFMWTQISYFNLKKNNAVVKRVIMVVQLYLPVLFLTHSKGLDNVHGFVFNSITNILLFLFVFCVMF